MKVKAKFFISKTIDIAIFCKMAPKFFRLFVFAGRGLNPHLGLVNQ